ncbi:MAG: hypothetical protein ACI9T9_003082 [Oleiphilaceae bacterium]|jgi:hypothetical protein
MPFNPFNFVDVFTQNQVLFLPFNENPPKRIFIELIFESLPHHSYLVGKDSGSVGYNKPDIFCNTFIT